MFDKDSELGTSIPDSALQVSEVFEESEWEEISRNVNIILREHNVLPLMHTLGDNLICIGEGRANFGKIYYYDFDFGIFELEDSLKSFLDKRVGL